MVNEPSEFTGALFTAMWRVPSALTRFRSDLNVEVGTGARAGEARQARNIQCSGDRSDCTLVVGDNVRIQQHSSRVAVGERNEVLGAVDVDGELECCGLRYAGARVRGRVVDVFDVFEVLTGVAVVGVRRRCS